MLIIEKSISNEPENISITFKGANITLSIRPLDGDALEQVREKAKIYKFADDPKTGQQKLGAIVDENAADLELFDYLIADAKGVGTAPDKPLPMTKEMKSRLVYQKPGKDDKPLWSTVIAAARELALQRRVALEAETKNS